MSQKVCHEHFSVVYTMKLLPNTYFMKCSVRNMYSQCILAYIYSLPPPPPNTPYGSEITCPIS